MRTAGTTLTFALTVLLLLASTERGHAWTFQFDGAEHDRDLVQALHVGPGGELYVAAIVDEEEGALFKLAPDTGATLWRYDFGGPPALLYDNLNDVTTDASGAVFAAGTFNINFDVVRVDPDTGQQIWHTSIDGPGNTHYDFAKAIAVDGFGGVVAVGGIQEHATPFGPDFAAVRFDAATGAVLWQTTIDGGAGDSSTLSRGEYGQAVAIASNGDPIAVGFLTVRMPGELNDDRLMIAARFARDDGHEIWRWTYRPAPLALGENFGQHVVLDAAGDVIVSGTHGFIGGNGGSAAVFKLDGATGAEVWRYVNTDERTNGIAVDGAGDVLVAAATSHADWPPITFHNDFTVLKLDGATGALVWRRQIPGRASDAEQVAVDAAQDVIAVGQHRGMVSAMKLAGADGQVLWTRQSNRPPAVTSYWTHLALDGAGRVFAGGVTSGPPQYAPEDLYIAGLDDAAGAGVGCGNGVLDVGETCDDGNAVDFDGCSATCTVEHCGDGVVDPDEQCDDGGHLDGDGCDAQCNFEGCGDGELGPGEQCDDGNRTAGDVCSATCQIEVCLTPTVATASRITLRKLGAVPGDERMSLRMEVTSPIGAPGEIQFIVEDLGSGGGPLVDLSYRTNPLIGGIPTPPGCNPTIDVRRSTASGDTYRNRSTTLPPTCAPGSAQGFSKMTVKAKGKVPGLYLIKADFQNSPLPTPVGPLRASVVMNEDIDNLSPGTCAQSAFTPSQCVAPSPSTFRCQ